MRLVSGVSVEGDLGKLWLNVTVTSKLKDFKRESYMTQVYEVIPREGAD